MAEDEEDDYLSMTFTDQTSTPKETSLQRTARLKKESQARGRILSKAERAEQEKAARETALATSLDASSNKGARMMAKMGFTPGSALGKVENARTTPIELQIKDDRGGIGMDSEKKRKIRDAADALADGEKRQKVGLDEFRERNRVEREEKRAEGQWWGAMKVLEGFENGGDGSKEDGDAFLPTQEEKKKKSEAQISKPKRLRDVNLLYRTLLKNRLAKERDRKMRYELNNSLSNRNDEIEEEVFDDRVEELEDEDLDLEEFEALPFAERREKVIAELREKYWYCFWCKFKYPDKEMEGCPGLSEDEHG